MNKCKICGEETDMPFHTCHRNIQHPGYIIEMFDGSVWLTRDGKVTPEWNEHGVWKTEQEAQEMIQKCWKDANTETTSSPS